MKKFIKVTVDTNDGDYISNFAEIAEEQLTLITPVIDAIKEYKATATPIYGTIHCFNYEGMNEIPDYPCKYFDEWMESKKDRGEEIAIELYGHLPGFKTFCEFLPEIDDYGCHSMINIDVYTVADIENLF